MKKITAIIFCIIFASVLCGCKSDPQTQSYYSYYYETVDASSEQEYSSVLQSSSSSEPQKSQKSTVAAPSKVIFYKNGQAVESADKEQNLKIAEHIESYFKGQDKILRLKSSISDSMVMGIKGRDMAIEVFFDEPTSFYGGVLHKKTATIFIPVDGQRKGMLIETSNNNYDRSSGPLRYSPEGLEKFFPEVMDQPEKLGPPEYCAIKQKYNAEGGKYTSTEKADEQTEYDANDLYVFENNDGVVIKQDSKTGEILSVDFGVVASHAASPLTEEVALEVAKSYVDDMYDLSLYDKQSVDKVTSGMMVTFMKTVSGFDTYQYLKVRVNEDKTISSINKTPNIFDGIDTSKISITEEEIIGRVEQNHIQKYGEGFLRLEFFSMNITVKDAKLKVKVYYQEKRQHGNDLSNGETIETYIDPV